MARASQRLAAALYALMRRYRQAPWPWGNPEQLKNRCAEVDQLNRAAEAADFLLDGAAAGDSQPLAQLLGVAAQISEVGPDGLLELATGTWTRAATEADVSRWRHPL